MESDAPAAQPTLLDLIDAARWQRLQDHFSRVMGIPIRTISYDRKLLVKPSWPSALLNDQTISLLRAGEELDQLIPVKNPPAESTSITTALGATYAAAPIRATADLIVGYFVIGPVVVGVREDEIDFRHRATAMGLDAAALWPVMLSLKLYTFGGIRSVLGLTEEVGSALAQFAYQAKELAGVLASPSAVEQAVARYHSEQVMRSLLSAATFATKADGGSVMAFDGSGHSLQIQAAQGLSDDVVTSVRSKAGEGLAGLAMAQREILLVDDRTTDERLRSRMHRPEIVSSIIAPITAETVSDPVGVLNLRTTSRDKRFTQEHVELLRRLLDLTRVALSNLHVAFTRPQK